MVPAVPVVIDSAQAESTPVNYRDLVMAGRRVRVIAVGLACCAVEAADGMASLQPEAAPPPEAASPAPEVHVLVVAGTVTSAIVAAVDEMWALLPEPKTVISFGACTISGGPYWDSYSVLPGLQGRFGPSIELAGCPPRADLLQAAVLQAVADAVGEHG